MSLPPAAAHTVAVHVVAADTFTHAVSDGPLLVAALAAAFVGVVAFLSPCVLPLVPGYLAYVAGISGAQSTHPRLRTVGGAALFVLGFTVIFVSGGLLFGSLGDAIDEHRMLLERVFGAITIVFGLVFLGWIPFAQRELKIHALPRAGLLGAPLLGMTFGLAWVPCLTPTLTVVDNLAFTQGTAGRGALLSAAYCIGLGIPFLLVAFGFGWVASAVGFFRRHARAVTRVGAGALILMGVLLVTGTWDHWASTLSSYNFGVGAEL